MKRRIDSFILITLAVMLTGCRSENQRTWDTLKECRQENTELSMQVQRLESEKSQLTEQVHTLSTLDAAARLETLDTLEKIRIGKHTGFYDKDDNGTNETLVVYLEPLDTTQDFVKAIGKVDIELWDLNAAEDKAKLAEWTLEPDQLHQTWGGTIFAGYYRLKFPVGNILHTEEKEAAATKNRVGTAHPTELTVKITFTDYLTGKVLTDQKVLPNRSVSSEPRQ